MQLKVVNESWDEMKERGLQAHIIPCFVKLILICRPEPEMTALIQSDQWEHPLYFAAHMYQSQKDWKIRETYSGWGLLPHVMPSILGVGSFRGEYITNVPRLFCDDHLAVL